MWTTPRQLTTAPPPTEEFCPLAEFTPHTGYEPKLLDDFHYSETSEMILQEQPSDKTRCPRTCVTRKSTMRPSGKHYLHHCSFRREENQRTEDKLITPMKKVCCQLSHFSNTQERGRPVHELSSCQKRKSSREMENERIRILLERQKEQILADLRTKIQTHEFQADSDRRSIQESNGIIESQRREIDHALAGDEQLRRDQLLLHEQLSEQNRDLREAHMESPRQYATRKALRLTRILI